MKEILKAIVDAGGKPLMVGGCVRDEILGIPCKDVDAEIFNLEMNEICRVLSRFGKVNIVGESFGVIKLSSKEGDFDFSLPRIDNKKGAGHKGFDIVVDHKLTPKQAAARRDFTINAIGKDVDGNFVDPYNGIHDLENKILRATSEHFAEDPLRVLRGFQFVSRFNLKAEEKTLEMCRELKNEFNSLPKERIWNEWAKWAEKCVMPSAGLRFLVDCGWISLFPELANIVEVPHDSISHPEGWELIARKSFLLPIDPCLASPAKSKGVDLGFTLRQFFSSSFANPACKPVFTSASAAEFRINFMIDGFSSTNNARTFSLGFPPSFAPTAFTQSKGFVWLFGRSAIEAGKIIRIMFKISKNCMHSIVFRSINDFEIIKAVIEPVAVFVVNMFTGKELSPKMKFHQDSMDSRSSSTSRPAGASISAVVIDFAGSSVDGDVIVYFDLRMHGNFDIHNSPVYLPATINRVVQPEKLEEISCFEVKMGGVWIHSQHVCDAAVEICNREGLQGEDRITIILAALCHDVGKAMPIHGGTSELFEGRWRSHGHADAGVPIAESFLKRIGCLDRIIERVLPLVKEHMVASTGIQDIGDRLVRRLSLRLGKASLQELMLVFESDANGRPPLPKGLGEAAIKIAAIAEKLALKVDKPMPFIKGRHLINRGYKPGPIFSQILGRCFDAQLDGVFSDEDSGIAFLESIL